LIEAWWVVVALVLLQPDPGFTTLSKADGYLLERRPVRDSAFYEYRVSVDLDAARVVGVRRGVRVGHA